MDKSISKKSYDFKIDNIKRKSNKCSFSGYASIFDVVDSQNDIVMNDGFILDNKKVIPLLWQHDMTNPIGRITQITQDDTGLYIVGELCLEIKQGREVFALLKDKIISGLSVGYSPIDYEFMIDRNGNRIRKIIKATLWEVSLVTFPANADAQITNLFDDNSTNNICDELENYIENQENILIGDTMNTTNYQNEQFLTNLVKKITTEVTKEMIGVNKNQGAEYKYNMNNNVKNNHHIIPKEQTYEEKVKMFEHFVKTGDMSMMQQKSMQGTPTNENGNLNYNNGSAFVSSILQNGIIKKMGQENIFRKISTVQMVQGDKTEYIQVLSKINELGWVGETDSRDGNTDTPQTTRLSIKLFEMYGQPRVSRDLLLNDSAIDISSWMREELGDAFAKTELLASLRGDGETKPMGLLHPNAKIQQIQTVTAATVSFQDLLNLYNSLETEYRDGACFVMSRQMQGLIYSLKDPNGNSVLQHSFKESFPNTLFGFPIYICSNMDSGTTSGHLPIIFGNFKVGYLIIDCNLNAFIRDEITEKQWVKFYATKRVGAMVVNQDALKILKVK